MQLIKILINVLSISVFIAFFFFTYGSHVEKQVIKKQMNFLCSNIAGFIKLFGQNSSYFILNQLDNLTLPDLEEEDKRVEESNSEIIMKVIKINIIFLLIVSALVYYLKPENLKEIISENIIILVFIALTEYSVLTFFGARYISADPNRNIRSFMENIKENI